MKTLLLIFLSLLQSGVSRVSSCSPERIQRKWDLWSNGTCLRGANIWQKVIDPKIDGDGLGQGILGPPYSAASLHELAALGANYVNVSHAGIFSEYPPYELDERAAANLDSLLDRIHDADMFAVISFRTGPGRNEVGFDAQNKQGLHSVWLEPRAQQGWVEMWRIAAARYRRHPAVVGYDLMVEPNANDIYFQASEPSEFYPAHVGSGGDWNVLAGKISQAVREVDLETPILVSSMNWGDVRWLANLALPPVEKVIAAAHFYSPYAYTHQEPGLKLKYPGRFDADDDGTVDSVGPLWLKNALSPISAFSGRTKIPVAVNETGVKRWAPGSETFLTDLLVALESAGVNHAVWLWESSHKGITYDDFNFRRGANPNHHADVGNAPLSRVMRRIWSRNQARPSLLPSLR